MPSAPRMLQPSVGEYRHTILLRLAATLIFLTIFDARVISSIPFARTLSALCGLVLMALFLVKRARAYRFYRGPHTWAIAFILFTVLSQIYRFLIGQEVGFAYYMQWFQILVLYMILCDLAKDPRAFVYIWMAVVATSVFMAFVSLIPVPGFSIEGAGRRGFEGVNFNVQAYWYNLGLISLFWLTLERFRRMPGWQIITLLLLVCLLFLALLRTGSRGGMVSMFAGVVTLLLFSLRKRNTRAYSMLVPLLITGGLLAILATDVIMSRMEATVSGEDDGSRGMIWGAALEMIRDHLWIGYGPRFMPELGYAIGWGSINTHQAYLQVTLAFGVPALLLWLGLIGSCVRRCWLARRSPVGGLFLALLLTSIAHGLSGDLGFNRYFWILLALAASVAHYQSLLRSRSRNWRVDLGLVAAPYVSPSRSAGPPGCMPVRGQGRMA